MPRIKCTLKSLTTTEQTLLEQLGYETMDKRRRCLVVKAIKTGKFHTMEEIQNVSIQELRQHIDKNPNPKYMRHVFRMLLYLVGRDKNELHGCQEAQNIHDPVLSFLLGRGSGPVWILAVLDNFIEWKKLAAPCSNRHMQTHRNRAARLLMHNKLDSLQALCELTLPHWISIIGEVVISQYETHHNSLHNQKRNTRKKDQKAGAPARALINHYSETARFLCDFLQIKLTSRINSDLVYRSIRHRVPLHNEMLVDCVDALTGDEMNTAIRACIDGQELLIITLLSRLGMRVGAVRNLRLPGVVDNFNQLQGVSPLPWKLRRYIRSLDKNNQFNDWDTNVSSCIREAFETYLNNFWRPRYESWETQGNKYGLVRGWVFPGRDYIGRVRDVPCDISLIRDRVQRVLCRIGITGSRAHPHAFRKGAITLLLKCGNPIKAVSVWAHHKNTAVTESCYDMRTYQDVVGQMVFPMGWDQKDNEENAVAFVDNVSEETHSTNEQAMNIIAEEVERREMAEERLDAVERELQFIYDSMPPLELQKYKEMLQSRVLHEKLPVKCNVSEEVLQL